MLIRVNKQGKRTISLKQATQPLSTPKNNISPLNLGTFRKHLPGYSLKNSILFLCLGLSTASLPPLLINGTLRGKERDPYQPEIQPSEGIPLGSDFFTASQKFHAIAPKLALHLECALRNNTHLSVKHQAACLTVASAAHIMAKRSEDYLAQHYCRQLDKSVRKTMAVQAKEKTRWPAKAPDIREILYNLQELRRLLSQ